VPTYHTDWKGQAGSRYDVKEPLFLNGSSIDMYSYYLLEEEREMIVAIERVYYCGM